MKFYGQASAVADKILAQFKAGSLPKSLAPVFLHRGDNTPCRKWSWNNQLLLAISGYSEARGIKQWNDVGRKVKKGEKAFFILAPLRVKVKTEVDEECDPKFRLIGFRAVPVFGYEQTEGDPIPGRQHAEQFLKNLPLREVADAWGLKISSYSGEHDSAAGWYSPSRKTIALGVEGLSTWCHELVHAADDRLGSLKERGQQWKSETVAELGGATLLHALGYTTDADLGGAYRYIAAHACDAGIEPINACLTVLKRVCDAVDLILTTAETIKAAGVAGKAA